MTVRSWEIEQKTKLQDSPNHKKFSAFLFSLPLITEISKSGRKRGLSENVDCRTLFPRSDASFSRDIIAKKEEKCECVIYSYHLDQRSLTPGPRAGTGT